MQCKAARGQGLLHDDKQKTEPIVVWNELSKAFHVSSITNDHAESLWQAWVSEAEMAHKEHCSSTQSDLKPNNSYITELPKS